MPGSPARPHPSPPDVPAAVGLAQPLPTAGDKNSWAGVGRGRKSFFTPCGEGQAWGAVPDAFIPSKGNGVYEQGKGFLG